MTLIIGAASPSHTMLVSDRRLTRVGAGGVASLVDEEANKATILTTVDGRVAIAFTGLATIGIRRGHHGPPPPGGFRTAWWLLEALGEALEPDRLLLPTLARLRELAEARFARLKARLQDRGVAFVIVGYRHAQGGVERVHLGLTNMVEGLRGGPSFRLYNAGPESDSNYVVATGSCAALRESDILALRPAIDGDMPPSAIVPQLVRVVRRSAARSVAHDTIGTQCTSIVLPCDPSRHVVSEYHPVAGSTRLYGVNHVYGHNGIQLVADPVVLGGAPGEPAIPIAGPKLGRNKPCWCGSKKKYKHCHGR